MAKNLTDIINDLIAYIVAKIPGISTRSGTVVKDVVIDSPAQEFESAYTEIDNVALLSSLQNYASFTTDQLNSVASDYGLTRLLGTKATGTIVFRFKALTDVNIPFNTRLSTAASTGVASVEFITSQTVIVSSANLPNYYNYLTSFYEVSVPIESSNIGASNNVAAGTITTVLSSISNLDSITNYLPTVNGTDDETNSSLSSRVQTKRLGNNIGTASGYETTVIADNRVLDSIVVGPNDTEMVRNEFGGSIDIYVLGTDLVQVSEAHTWNNTISEIVLNNQPIPTGGIVSVTGALTGLLTLTTDYAFTKDIGVLANSSASSDKISFTAVGIPKLVAGGTQDITVVYSYNSLITDLQATLNIDTSHITASDVLIREANEILVNIYADVSTLSGYDKATIQAEIETALGTTINAFKLNTDLQPSDVVAIIAGVTGVDKVGLTTLQPNTDVIANKTQYLRVGTITINML